MGKSNLSFHFQLYFHPKQYFVKKNEEKKAYGRKLLVMLEMAQHIFTVM